MNLMKKVKNLWVLERHPKGALAVRPLMDVLERNYQRWETRAQDPGWEPLGVFPTLESGQEGERTLKRRFAAIRAIENKLYDVSAKSSDNQKLKVEIEGNNDGDRKISEPAGPDNGCQGSTPAEQT